MSAHNVNELPFNLRIPLGMHILPFHYHRTLFCSHTTEMSPSSAITADVTMVAIVTAMMTAWQSHSDGHGIKHDV